MNVRSVIQQGERQVKKIIAGVFLLLLIGIAIWQAIDSKTEEKAADERLGGLKAGVQAPDFKLKTLDGKEASLSDYRGKKVFLNFWATWCTPCKEEMPAMEEISDEYGNDLVILAVNIDSQNDVQAFADNYGLTYPILLDDESEKKQSVNDTYQVKYIPTSFFIDASGLIDSVYLGAMNKKQMKQKIDQIK